MGVFCYCNGVGRKMAKRMYIWEEQSCAVIERSKDLRQMSLVARFHL